LTQVSVIYGPPGTGKTTELIRRLEERLGQGIDRREIAYVSFTKAAAEEVLGRMGLRRSEKVCTLHALAFRLLQLNSGQVVDTEMLQELVDKTGIAITGATPDSERELQLGDEFISLYQYAVAVMGNPDEVYQHSHHPGSLQMFRYWYQSYRRWKEANGYLDFNDMLVRYSGGKGPALKARVLFIDEAQDLSPLQWATVQRLAQDVEEVHIGGDDDQAIFEWSGADPGGMVAFERQYSAERVVLSQSWRLPRVVHALGTRIIERVRNRVPKAYSPRASEGQVTRHGDIHSVGRVGDEKTLVLYRNHSNRRELEDYLLQNAVPYHSIVGRPSPLQGAYAWAIRTYEALAAGHDVSKQSADAMKKRLTSTARRWVADGGLPGLLRMATSWKQVIEVPWALSDYFSRVDLSPQADVRVRLGSIHSSKGREADRVILLTAMGRRTIDSAVQNPDGEIRVWYVGVTRARERLDIIEGSGSFQI
jgi:DNA helicase-2/ATP-dependent DNA helicase PcrA